MNKRIRLNKRTLITFYLPYIDISKNYLNLDFTNKLLFQWFNYDIVNRKALHNYYNLDIEVCLLGFGISVETVINKKKLTNIIETVKTYFNLIK